METVGLRQLRQDASDLVQRAEAGEEITVSGRPCARLVSAEPNAWKSWAQIAELFTGAADLGWEQDRDLIGNELRDPWVPL